MYPIAQIKSALLTEKNTPILLGKAFKRKKTHPRKKVTAPNTLRSLHCKLKLDKINRSKKT